MRISGTHSESEDFHSQEDGMDVTSHSSVSPAFPARTMNDNDMPSDPSSLLLGLETTPLEFEALGRATGDRSRKSGTGSCQIRKRKTKTKGGKSRFTSLTSRLGTIFSGEGENEEVQDDGEFGKMEEKLHAARLDLAQSENLREMQHERILQQREAQKLQEQRIQLAQDKYQMQS